MKLGLGDLARFIAFKDPGGNTYSRLYSSVLNELTLSPENATHSEAYERVASVYGCISRVQGSMSELPLEFYDTSGTLIPSDPIPQRFGRPAKRTVAGLFAHVGREDTCQDHMEQITGGLLMHGAAYDILQYTKGQPGVDLPDEIVCVPGYAMKPKVNRNRHIDNYVLCYDDGREVPVPTWQVIPYRMYSTGHDFEPLSPLDVARLAFTTERDMQRWASEFFKRGGMVGGLISTKDGLAPKQRDDVERSLDLRRRTDPLKPFVIDAEAKFEKMGLTLKEMDFLGVSRMTREDICHIFKIPPVIAGLKEGGGLSDAGAMTDMLLYWELCLKPLCRKVTEAISHHFLDNEFHAAELGGQRVECGFNIEGVLPLQNLNFQRGQQLLEAVDETISTNEWRTIMNLEPYEDDRADRIAKFDRQDAEIVSLTQPQQPQIGGGSPKSSRGTDAPRDELGSSRKARLLSAAGEGRRTVPMRASRDARKVQSEGTMRTFVRLLFAQQRKRAEADLKRLFDDNRIAATAHNANAVSIEELLKSGSEADRKLARKYLKIVARRGGDAELADIGRKIELSTRTAAFEEWLESRADILIVGTTRTTNEMIREALAEGLAENETFAELLARLRDVFRERYEGQGERIVRTETNGAYNFGAREAWRQSRVVTGKTWVTAGDELVRDAHAEADGQTVPVDDLFEVGGEQLDYPGDADHGAGPGNTVYCRCNAAPVVDEELLSALNASGDGVRLNGHGSIRGIRHLLVEARR